jgi:hypothetical protein
LKAYLGFSESDVTDFAPLRDLVQQGRSFWLIAGEGPVDARPVSAVIVKHVPGLELRTVVASDELPRDRGWPGRVILFEAIPASPAVRPQ